MTRLALASLAMALAVCLGCQPDFHATQIVQPNTDPGRIRQNIEGTAEQLLKSKRIDAHRRVAAADKAEMDVWVLKPAAGTQPRGTVVILHGIMESKATWPYPGVAGRLRKLGYTAVLMDLRAHGRSGGEYVTYGAKEKHDVKAVMDALAAEDIARPPFYAFGTDLGAAVAIQYAAIDPRCKAVMAIAPYKDMRTHARRQLWALSEKDFEVALGRMRELADFDPADASAVVAAARLRGPLLLIHGMFNVAVPKEYSKAIVAAAGGPKKLVLLTSPERVALVTVLEDWIAGHIDKLATKGLSDATTKPNAKP